MADTPPPHDVAAAEGFFPSFFAATQQLSQLLHLGWAGLTAGFVLGGAGNTLRASRLEEQDPNALRFETFAKEQAAVGFQVLYEVATVRLVSILDAMVSHFVKRRLKRGSPVLSLPGVAGLKGSLVEFARASEDEQAGILLELLREALKSRFKRGVDRFEVLLKEIGYGGAVAPEVRRTLLELVETRNTIIHRMSVADAQLVERCPWLNLKVDDAVRVGKREYIRYFQACHWYAVELSLRALQAGEVEIPGTREELLEFQSSLIEGLRSAGTPPPPQRES